MKVTLPSASGPLDVTFPNPKIEEEVNRSRPKEGV